MEEQHLHGLECAIEREQERVKELQEMRRRMETLGAALTSMAEENEVRGKKRQWILDWRGYLFCN